MYVRVETVDGRPESCTGTPVPRVRTNAVIRVYSAYHYTGPQYNIRGQSTSQGYIYRQERHKALRRDAWKWLTRSVAGAALN